MGRAAAVLTARAAVATALLAPLVSYYALATRFPPAPLWADVLLTALLLAPAAFALVLLALPLREHRGLAPVGLALAALAAVAHAAGLDVLANFAKLGAAALVAFWVLGFFERLSWLVLVAAVIPIVDFLSVWRGPTRHIVSERPEVFGALSFAFPLPGAGSFQLGITDLLFFALFLAATARWRLRVGSTWLALVASLGVTIALTVSVDPFGLGGLPALPGISLAFLAANGDLLWRSLRRGDEERVVAVEDVDAAYARALEAGAEVVHAPRDEPHGRTARYRDRDGNVVALRDES